MNEIHKRRINSVFKSLPPEVDLFVSTPCATLRYLTGLNLHKSERPMLAIMTQNGPIKFLAPRLEKERLESHLGESAVICTYDDSSDAVEAARTKFTELFSGRALNGKVAVEYDSTRLLECEVMRDRFEPAGMIDASPAVSEARVQKDSREIENLRTATKITDRILIEVIENIEPGVTELDVQRMIQSRVLKSDAERFGVDIITSGPRTANPHASTSSRVITEGDPVMIDTGVVYEGYYSDITRTIVVGEPTEEISRIYTAVREAARATREITKGRIACNTLDLKAREVITDYGYGEYFPHRVGHGTGLDSHEPPYLASNNADLLLPGSVITVEPGVYVRDVGGVRIEDNLLVTEDGVEVLTESSRELITI